MGIKPLKSGMGWYYENETKIDPSKTYTTTFTTGNTIEIKASNYKDDTTIINSPISIPQNDKSISEKNYAQGWVCPKCGRVNAPWSSVCPCYLSNNIFKQCKG